MLIVRPGACAQLGRDFWQTSGKHEHPKQAETGLGRLKERMHNSLTLLGILEYPVRA
jgi:hypothetical protein